MVSGEVRASCSALYGTVASRGTTSGWGLVAVGVLFVAFGSAFIPIVRAKNADGTSKYIPQGSESFKVALSVFLAVAGVVMVIAGFLEAL